MSGRIPDARAETVLRWLQSLSDPKAPFEPPTLLAADASFRRYFRTRCGRETRVVMDAPPDRENLLPYLQVASVLRELGLRAPDVLARDLDAGLLLLEDLGDMTFTRALRAGVDEADLYRLAVSTLRELQVRWLEGSLPDRAVGIPEYGRPLLLDEASLFLDWYWPFRLGAPAGERARETFREAWNTTLDALPGLPKVLVLRDFHVDNLMLLPPETTAPESGDGEAENAGTDSRPGMTAGSRDSATPAGPLATRAQCGLLDFQDAVLGSPAYDLVSLLDDARRDVSPAVQQTELERYLAGMPFPREAFLAQYRVLGVQRATKVIGIFTRLDRRDGKPAYQRHQPRLWRQLWDGLRHPELAPMRAWFVEYFPETGNPCAP